VNPPAADGLHPPEENFDNSRSTSSDLHSGHSRSRSASDIRRSNSKALPHFWQRYSYKGIVRFYYQDAKTGRLVTIEYAHPSRRIKGLMSSLIKSLTFSLGIGDRVIG
jgi:hypothetical protein